MPKTDLRFRQIHLDFHTSELIPGVGAKFDPDEYADTLKRAAVDSVTTFARCHHGYLYFDSKAHPELIHPNLVRKNLLKEQIKACHKRDIRVPIYVTVGWDQVNSQRHPEWCVLTDKAELQGTKPYEAGFYRQMCPNTPYVDFLKEHIQEVLDTLPTDGFFFDIMFPSNCSCYYCKSEMVSRGLDASNEAVRKDFGIEVTRRFEREMTRFIRKTNKTCTIFWNAGHIGPALRPIKDAFTHWELESLPSGGWGYMHFPVTQRFARTMGLDCMGMTGKFQTSWGDFGSYKNPPALQFECFQMLALNAKCSVGDQLPPSGKIDKATYELIGSVYREVEKKEPWCRGAGAVTDIAVLTPEATGTPGAAMVMGASIQGVVRMLQEGGHQFDVIDTEAGLSPYKLLVLPDDVVLTPELAAKIDRYVADGGSLIASFMSGINAGKNACLLKSLGIDVLGDAPFSPDFIRPGKELSAGLMDAEFVMYTKGLHVKARAGTKTLADVAVPYFNRDWRHFCSHAHTPSSGKVGYAGVTRRGNAIYFAHPIFTQYQKNAPLWCKKLVLNAVSLLLADPVLRHNGPSSVVATLNEQAKEKRYVAHLLYYVPERRGAAFDVIEDVVPLYGVGVSIRVPKSRKIKSIKTAPAGVTLPFSQSDSRVDFTLPQIVGHEMVAIQF